jgi:hypothetical protein
MYMILEKYVSRSMDKLICFNILSKHCFSGILNVYIFWICILKLRVLVTILLSMYTKLWTDTCAYVNIYPALFFLINMGNMISYSFSIDTLTKCIRNFHSTTCRMYEILRSVLMWGAASILKFVIQNFYYVIGI